ncbi:MAG TPA: zf-HC2 domain-containing protein [Ilumatobacteraceae bacterium]|jgi:anti-sigma factor RsiW
MRLFRRRAALVCRQAVALMADYLDGRLTTTDARRLETHLAACPHCSEYLAQLRVTIDALGHAEPDELSQEALDDLVDLYRRWRAD